MKIKPVTIFTSVLTLAIGAALFISLQYPFYSGLYVWVAGTVAFILCILELLNQIKSMLRERSSGKIQSQTTNNTREPVITILKSNKNSITLISWFIALFALVWLLGFKVGIVLFFISYLTIRARNRWYKTLVVTAFAVMFLLLFDMGLHASLPEGILKESLPWLP